MSIAGFERVAIIGAGQMGSGIAQVCATQGLQVTLIDVSAEQLERAQAAIARSVTKLEGKGKIPAGSKESIAGRLQYATDMVSLKDCDLVIEAIVENEDIKGSVLREVDGLLKPEGIIATNTSSIPITRLAATTQRPHNVIGMHFMNPVPIMKLVEVIPGFATDPQVTERVLKLAEGLGKETTKSQDYPGFVVNRILMPMINEAFCALQEGIASREDIDKGMRLGCNQPMGPLTLADFIGLDTCLAILQVLHDGFGDPRYRPSPLLKKYVEAGYCGVKTGRGVYEYKN